MREGDDRLHRFRKLARPFVSSSGLLSPGWSGTSGGPEGERAGAWPAARPCPRAPPGRLATRRWRNSYCLLPCAALVRSALAVRMRAAQRMGFRARWFWSSSRPCRASCLAVVISAQEGRRGGNERGIAADVAATLAGMASLGIGCGNTGTARWLRQNRPRRTPEAVAKRSPVRIAMRPHAFRPARLILPARRNPQRSERRDDQAQTRPYSDQQAYSDRQTRGRAAAEQERRR